MKTTHPRLPLASGQFLALCTLAACSSAGQNLEPAMDAHRVQTDEDAAVASDKGVEIVAHASEWPGGARITSELTPMRVTLTNNSGQPLRVQYRSFTLVASDGETFSAIPPLQAEGEARDKYATYVAPKFGYSGFMVAPYYGYAYPDIVAYPGPFAYDPLYYDTYYGYWETEDLPTPEMIAWALPEGVLQPGGQLSGYLYFQRVSSDDAQRVQFQAHLETAPEAQGQSSTGEPSAAQPAAPEKIDISIPFAVE